MDDQVLEKLDVRLLARVDLLAQRPRERAVLVQDDRNLPVARAHDQVDVADDGLAKLFAGIVDGFDFFEHGLVQDVHAVVHDFIEEAVLAPHVVIDPGLGQVDRLGDVLHGGAVVSLFVEDARRDAADFPELVLRLCLLRHGIADD